MNIRKRIVVIVYNCIQPSVFDIYSQLFIHLLYKDYRGSIIAVSSIIDLFTISFWICSWYISYSPMMDNIATNSELLLVGLLKSRGYL
jgi:hypothetical protein